MNSNLCHPGKNQINTRIYIRRRYGILNKKSKRFTFCLVGLQIFWRRIRQWLSLVVLFLRPVVLSPRLRVAPTTPLERYRQKTMKPLRGTQLYKFKCKYRVCIGITKFKTKNEYFTGK